MQLDFNTRELTVKLVYYGPALSGKTSNLQALHRLLSPEGRGRLMTLETKDDRTLFFDMLPLVFRTGKGLQVRIKLFTVPGQVLHNATRKLVLQGADGIAFIADSRRSELQSNAEAFLNLQQNLKDQGLSIARMPLVIQFNKRDLPDVRPDTEIDELARQGREPVYKAIALQGVGVIETFVGLIDITWRHLSQEHDLSGKFSINPEDVIQDIGKRLGITMPMDSSHAHP